MDCASRRQPKTELVCRVPLEAPLTVSRKLWPGRRLTMVVCVAPSRCASPAFRCGHKISQHTHLHTYLRLSRIPMWTQNLTAHTPSYIPGLNSGRTPQRGAHTAQNPIAHTRSPTIDQPKPAAGATPGHGPGRQCHGPQEQQAQRGSVQANNPPRYLNGHDG